MEKCICQGKEGMNTLCTVRENTILTEEEASYRRKFYSCQSDESNTKLRYGNHFKQFD